MKTAPVLACAVPILSALLVSVSPQIARGQFEIISDQRSAYAYGEIGYGLPFRFPPDVVFNRADAVPMTPLDAWIVAEVHSTPFPEWAVPYSSAWQQSSVSTLAIVLAGGTGDMDAVDVPALVNAESRASVRFSVDAPTAVVVTYDPFDLVHPVHPQQTPVTRPGNVSASLTGPDGFALVVPRSENTEPVQFATTLAVGEYVLSALAEGAHYNSQDVSMITAADYSIRVEAAVPIPEPSTAVGIALVALVLMAAVLAFGTRDHVDRFCRKTPPPDEDQTFP